MHRATKCKSCHHWPLGLKSKKQPHKDDNIQISLVFKDTHTYAQTHTHTKTHANAHARTNMHTQRALRVSMATCSDAARRRRHSAASIISPTYSITNCPSLMSWPALRPQPLLFFGKRKKGERGGVGKPCMQMVKREGQQQNNAAIQPALHKNGKERERERERERSV